MIKQKQINVRVPESVYSRLETYRLAQEITQKQAIVDAINHLTNAAESDPLRQEVQELKLQVQMLMEQRVG